MRFDWCEESQIPLKTDLTIESQNLECVHLYIQIMFFLENKTFIL